MRAIILVAPFLLGGLAGCSGPTGGDAFVPWQPGDFVGDTRTWATSVPACAPVFDLPRNAGLHKNFVGADEDIARRLAAVVEDVFIGATRTEESGRIWFTTQGGEIGIQRQQGVVHSITYSTGPGWPAADAGAAKPTLDAIIKAFAPGTWTWSDATIGLQARQTLSGMTAEVAGNAWWRGDTSALQLIPSVDAQGPWLDPDAMLDDVRAFAGCVAQEEGFDGLEEREVTARWIPTHDRIAYTFTTHFEPCGFMSVYMDAATGNVIGRGDVLADWCMS